MNEMITGITRGGRAWTPAFVTGVNQATCIGCGRCYKVCPREVFELVEREIDDDDLDDCDDDFDDDVVMVMAVKDADDCIGCESCSRVCPKKCHSHAPASAAA